MLDSRVVTMLELFIPAASLPAGAVVAGFSTRHGGDEVTSLARAAGFDPRRLFALDQVHGARVVRVERADDPADVATIRADAMVTTEPGVVLAVKTADCVPVLLAHRGGSAVAAVHAGWRGLVAHVVGAAVAALSELSGAPPSELVAAVGPAIGVCCYEVSREVADEVARAAGTADVVQERLPRPHVDLRSAVLARLERTGIPRDGIEVVGSCTRCRPDMFHSFRHEGPRSGRQLSFVFIRDLDRASAV